MTVTYHIPVLNCYCLDEVVNEMDKVDVHAMEFHKWIETLVVVFKVDF